MYIYFFYFIWRFCYIYQKRLSYSLVLLWTYCNITKPSYYNYSGMSYAELSSCIGLDRFDETVLNKYLYGKVQVWVTYNNNIIPRLMLHHRLTMTTTTHKYHSKTDNQLKQYTKRMSPVNEILIFIRTSLDPWPSYLRQKRGVFSHSSVFWRNWLLKTFNYCRLRDAPSHFLTSSPMISCFAQLSRRISKPNTNTSSTRLLQQTTHVVITIPNWKSIIFIYVIVNEPFVNPNAIHWE